MIVYGLVLIFALALGTAMDDYRAGKHEARIWCADLCEVSERGSPYLKARGDKWVCECREKRR